MSYSLIYIFILCCVKSRIYFVYLYFPHMRLCILFNVSRNIQVDSIELLCERPRPWSVFYMNVLGQTHVNGWSRVVASQNGGSTDYIFPLRLGVLQWSRHLFNYWKNKKTIMEKFLILLI